MALTYEFNVDEHYEIFQTQLGTIIAERIPRKLPEGAPIALKTYIEYTVDKGKLTLRFIQDKIDGTGRHALNVQSMEIQGRTPTHLLPLFGKAVYSSADLDQFEGSKMSLVLK